MPRFRMLQLFNRYQQYGGEEASVRRIGDALAPVCEVEDFITASDDLLEGSFWQVMELPRRLFRNAEVEARLLERQAAGRFDLWQVHNVFPGMSPGAYARAFELGIPMVHFLHNYRFGCTNGFFLNHGEPCERCLHGNFWPAVVYKSWRESRLMSAAMGAAITYARKMGVFHRVAHWVALNGAQRDKYVEMGVPAGKITVVPHFHEPLLNPPPPSPGGDALFVGRLSIEKGIAVLLDAWKQLAPSGRRLVIAGDGPARAELEEKVRVEGLQNVHFTGFIPPAELAGYWAKAAFIVLPSIWLEPHPLVVLEAFANGRPAIASNLGGLAETVEHGRTGWLVEPFNAAALAETMGEAFSSPEKLRAMGAEGLKVLDERFTRAQWLQKMQAIYDRVLG